MYLREGNIFLTNGLCRILQMWYSMIFSWRSTWQQLSKPQWLISRQKQRLLLIFWWRDVFTEIQSQSHFHEVSLLCLLSAPSGFWTTSGLSKPCFIVNILLLSSLLQTCIYEIDSGAGTDPGFVGPKTCTVLEHSLRKHKMMGTKLCMKVDI